MEYSEKAREKSYAITYWSNWGMGSDTEVGLITEPDLRELILMETGRYREDSDLADSRFSGTCEGEAFCDSDDPEEVFADVVNKRLNTCTTYAGHNDLIELPEDVDIVTSDLKMGRTIVRLSNQFGFARDIIFGEGDFRLYSIDLTQDWFKDNDLFYYEEGDDWIRFASYDLKNVSENHMSGFSDLEFVLDVSRKKLNRMTAKRDGFEVKHKGAYITDLIPEIATDDYVAESIAEAQCTIDKFTNLPEFEDEYETYLYPGKNCRSPGLRRMINAGAKAVKGKDYTKHAYDYPISPNAFGVICNQRYKDSSRYLTYSELFDNGYDMRYLIADISNRAQTLKKLGPLDLVSVFGSVFAYD